MGDRLRVRVTSETSDAFRAEIADILSPSSQRAPAPCPHFAQCGGCTLQHLPEADYRAFKTRIAENAIKQAGFNMAPDMVFLPAASRRRAEFKWTGSALAYLQPRSHTKLAIGQCVILDPALQALLQPLTEALRALPGAQHITSVSLTKTDSGIGLELTSLYPIEVYEYTLQGLGITSLSVNGNEHIKPLTMQLGNHPIRLPAGAFLQATTAAQTALTEFARTHTIGARHIVDLFCGLGTYSLPISVSAKIHAVENDEAMVTALTNADAKNLTAEKRDLFKNPLSAKELARFDAAIINPPRAGAKAQTEQLATAKMHTIVMISCNPGTFARDAKILKNAGYSLTHTLAIDQFVYSPHLEIAAAFSGKINHY